MMQIENKNPKLSFPIFKNLDTPFWYPNCEWTQSAILINGFKVGGGVLDWNVTNTFHYPMAMVGGSDNNFGVIFGWNVEGMIGLFNVILVKIMVKCPCIMRGM
jgi:hypothetical protein